MSLPVSTTGEGRRRYYQSFINEKGDAQGSKLTLQGPQLHSGTERSQVHLLPLPEQVGACTDVTVSFCKKKSSAQSWLTRLQQPGQRESAFQGVPYTL